MYNDYNIRRNLNPSNRGNKSFLLTSIKTQMKIEGCGDEVGITTLPEIIIPGLKRHLMIEMKNKINIFLSRKSIGKMIKVN